MLSRNIPRNAFVYTNAAACSAVRGETHRKPRGGSHGVATRNLSGR